MFKLIMSIIDHFNETKRLIRFANAVCVNRALFESNNSLRKRITDTFKVNYDYLSTVVEIMAHYFPKIKYSASEDNQKHSITVIVENCDTIPVERVLRSGVPAHTYVEVKLK